MKIRMSETYSKGATVIIYSRASLAIQLLSRSGVEHPPHDYQVLGLDISVQPSHIILTNRQRIEVKTKGWTVDEDRDSQA